MLRQITVIWSLYKPWQMATSVILGGQPTSMVLGRPLKCYLTLLGKLVGWSLVFC
ncbi:MAG: putative MFS family arabinose efflux permease [Moritella dasanensis]|jgi:predicted MFS family arabinose efflux permease